MIEEQKPAGAAIFSYNRLYNLMSNISQTQVIPPVKSKMAQFSKKHFYLLLTGIFGIIITIILSMTFLSPYTLKLAGLWIVSFVFFFAMRYPDSWKMGLEVFYLFTFIYAYVFDVFFTLPIIFLSFWLVTRFRPDELNGVVVHLVVLTGLALTARLFYGWYGIAITADQFLFALMLSTIIWLIADAIIALKTAPVPLPKLVITHSLETIVTYYAATFFGYKALQFFLAFAKG